ncbi:hypothetical protein J6S88_01300 [bacterium]|nr:hypothetical protein [bacterium]
MQVQTVNSTNNYSNPAFKAYFVKDSQRTINYLWNRATKRPELLEQINNFTRKNVNHALEIVSSGINGDYMQYEILNHLTGKISKYLIDDIKPWSSHLSLLLKEIDKDKVLFKQDEFSKSYQLLTGKIKPNIPNI